MTINVKHVAKLANLNLPEKELKKFESQLSSILEYVERLKSLDTNDVKETSQTTGLENITRKDEPTPSLTSNEATSSTDLKENELFKVKAIFE